MPGWDWIRKGHLLESQIQEAQFFKRLNTLHPEPWENYSFDTLRSQLASVLSIPRSDLFSAFDSNQLVESLAVSELNRLVAERSAAPKPGRLVFDEPLLLQSSTCYDFTGIVCEVGDARLLTMILGKNAEDVEILQWRAQPGNRTNGIWLRQCKRVAVRRCRIEEALHAVIVRSRNTEIRIEECQFFHNHRSAIFVQGDNRNLVIVDNVVDKTGHSSNYAAALALVSVPIHHEDDLTLDFGENYHGVQAVHYNSRLGAPRRVLITRNEILRSQTSGIYCDGALEVVIDNNRVKQCDKEGICLDSGSALCLLLENRIEGNGARAYQADEALQMEFVLEHGRDATGASVVKLPGISMDNCMANRIRRNVISHNWGGGVKMVRSSVFNVVTDNRILHNDPPAAAGWRWAGIMIDGARHDEPGMYKELDFFPGGANLVADNVIDRHEPGIHLVRGAAFNRLIGNEIIRSKKSIEARHAPGTVLTGNTTTGKVIRYIWGWSHLRYGLREVKLTGKRIVGIAFKRKRT